jgi:menaquinone-9 beta-reductase
MSALKTITIIGGGLAGLTLGIGLRKAGVPVVIHEAGEYPRHKVCGEFISGRGIGTLQRLGLFELLKSAAARPAQTVAFFWQDRALARHELPEPAWCLSRFTLDQSLAEHFVSLDGVLHRNSRWTGCFVGEGLVRASGRRLKNSPGHWRWIGLKAHACAVPLTADLEMHWRPHGYVGLCRLPHDRINVCGLFRSRTPFHHLQEQWPAMLAGDNDNALRQRLSCAQFLPETFGAVAGLHIDSCMAVAGECAIGDALTMVPPVTGNGMSLAFESAEIALPKLVQFSQGVVSWESATQQIRRSFQRQFRGRLRTARYLHTAMFNVLLSQLLLWALPRCRNSWHWAFAHTR